MNKKLIRCAADEARLIGAHVTLIDLRDLPMPLYDGDLEQDEGMPINARKFFDLMKSHDGMLISCPEYNGSITAVLKNAIDWASRSVPGEPNLAAFRNKTAGLLAATPGGIGGIRALDSVRFILGNLGVMIVPRQFGLGNAGSAFDENGNLTSDSARSNVAAVAKQLVQTTAQLKHCPE